jgi:hypothetical protein
MIEPSKILYITCSNQHKARKIALVVPRENFQDVFKPEATRQGNVNLIWVNTPTTTNLLAPEEMPSGTTDLDRKHIVICPKPTCRHPVDATEETFRVNVYEPATRSGRTSMDIRELERILTTGS